MKQSFEMVHLKSGEAALRWIEGGETFHPGIGAGAESRCLIVEQLQLSQRFAEVSTLPLKIWDVGLGAGGNAAAILQCWQEVGLRSLELVSFDCSLDPLRLAVKAHQQSEEYFPWLKKFPTGRLIETGKTEYVKNKSKARWTFCLGDFTDQMKSEAQPELMRPDFIIYDFFSPARDYLLWTLDHWKNVRRWLSESHCTWIVFHSRSTALRATLLLAGFFVGRGVAIGDKEETTLACTQLLPQFPALSSEWLEKVQRSSASEPFVGPIFQPGKISSSWMFELRRHPQFNSRL